MTRNINTYLAELLKIYWLRPETALWRSFDCLLMEKYGDISGRSVDFGCGDGTMSFVMAGGKIDGYDVFMDAGNLQQYKEGTDIYNHPTKIDINYDAHRLHHSYHWGVDHKENLISKAKRFVPFYQNNLVSDLNKKLPFEDNYFDSAFSNILNWLDDINNTLLEWRRILNKQGRLFLFVPNVNFREKGWLYYAAPHTGRKQYLNYFDRGYSALLRHNYSASQWSKIFRENGFSVVDHHLYITDPVVDVWNIGTRPISSLLIDMVNMLSFEQRENVKAEWIDYFSNFFQPILEGEWERKVSESEAAFHFFILEKK